jgi:hypothetical protein
MYNIDILNNKGASMYSMFSPEGNELVARIVEAALKQKAHDGAEQAFIWADHQLTKLSYGHNMGEATDTAVREAVYEAIN